MSHFLKVTPLIRASEGQKETIKEDKYETSEPQSGETVLEDS